MTTPITTPLRLVGVPGSPYSRKLRAVLRYRRIPHAWVTQGSPESRELPQPRVALLPQLIMPGTGGTLEARTDTTPIIRTLEKASPERSVIPPDAAVAFVDALIEDYADEWLTKAMFHYRWAFAADVANAAAILPRWFRTNQPEGQAVSTGTAFAKRQVGRLAVVGSNAVTAPVIEESYRRLLALLDARLTPSRFVLGARPATGDFALFGQLTQLTGFDPTPMALARGTAPRVTAWVDVVEDLSGLEPQDTDWAPRERVFDELRPLLAEIGRVYVPFLLANGEALARGAEQMECVIDGRPWRQRPFPYQGKCLRWLREGYAALGDDDRRTVGALLADTGCERLVAG
jgi:glutathione S-transferase